MQLDPEALDAACEAFAEYVGPPYHPVEDDGVASAIRAYLSALPTSDLVEGLETLAVDAENTDGWEERAMVAAIEAAARFLRRRGHPELAVALREEFLAESAVEARSP